MGGFIGRLLFAVGAWVFVRSWKKRPKPSASAPESDVNPVFEFTDERRFQLYMAERENLAKAAREGYQRVDQLIVGVSAGSIVLSINFLKDIGRTPDTLVWLLSSWGCFLVASFCALLSLWSSAERDRDSIVQLDCQVETGTCDETKKQRLSKLTKRLNVAAFFLSTFGVIFLIVFATKNLLHKGDAKWRPKENPAVVAPKSLPAEQKSLRGPAPSGTRSAVDTAPKPIRETPSPRR